MLILLSLNIISKDSQEKYSTEQIDTLVKQNQHEIVDYYHSRPELIEKYYNSEESKVAPAPWWDDNEDD